MRYIVIAIILYFLVIGALAETDTTDVFLDCVREYTLPMAPTQSVIGEYTWIKKSGDTLTGNYFLVPPQANFITVGDTVERVPFDTLRQQWFMWWIDRNPIRHEHLFDVTALGDSASFAIYDYAALDSTKPNVRVAYDRGTCFPFYALFYWPKSARHAFPGIDAIYYEFTVTERNTLAPALRVYLDRNGKAFEKFIYRTTENVNSTPGEDEIIQFLMGRYEIE
ncbi:hypothetical protein DRQ36_02080 [bacterium]|nr:MAG: hypothetical protein DRQ36_02080 [bacterium]